MSNRVLFIKKIGLLWLSFAILFLQLAFPRPVSAQADFCTGAFYKSGEFTDANKLDKVIVSRGLLSVTFLNTSAIYVVFPLKPGATAANTKLQAGYGSNWYTFGTPQEITINEQRYVYFALTDLYARSQEGLAGLQLSGILNNNNPTPFKASWDGVQCSNSSNLPVEEDAKLQFTPSCDSILITACQVAKDKNDYRLFFSFNYYNFEVGREYRIGEDYGIWAAGVHLVGYVPQVASGAGFTEAEEYKNLSAGTHKFCIDTKGIANGIQDSCVTAPKGCWGEVNLGAETKLCSGEEKAIDPINSDKAPGASFNLCTQIPKDAMAGDVSARVACCDCAGGTLDNATGKCATKIDGEGKEEAVSGLWTSIGCVRTDQEGLIKHLLRLGLMISGGVTLLVILAGAFMLSTSSGDPKKAGEAKDQITAAIMGLVFVIFSITLLRFIGVDILQIPGFGGK